MSKVEQIANAKKPFEVRLNADDLEVTCPCGAGIQAEGNPVNRFYRAHIRHTNGRVRETLTADGARFASFGKSNVRNYKLKL